MHGMSAAMRLRLGSDRQRARFFPLKGWHHNSPILTVIFTIYGFRGFCQTHYLWQKGLIVFVFV